MNTSHTLKGLIVGTALMGLSSCSLVYNVEILVRNGAIVFVPYELGLFGRRLKEPVRIERIVVQRMDRTPSDIWDIESQDLNGTMLSDVTYGKTPAHFRQKIAPQKLEVGRLYLVDLRALGGGGDQYFVMSPYSGFYEAPKVTFLTPLVNNESEAR